MKKGAQIPYFSSNSSHLRHAKEFTFRKVRSRTLTADTTTNEPFGSFLCRASKKSGNWFNSSVGVVAGFAVKPINQVLIGLDGNHLT